MKEVSQHDQRLRVEAVDQRVDAPQIVARRAVWNWNATCAERGRLAEVRRQ
jgi:hypothetical protein